MKIVIKQPAGLHEAGSAGHNQDFVYPPLNTTNSSEVFFYVGDGDGPGGETAAKQVVLNFAKFFAGQDIAKGLSQAMLDEGLRTAEEALSNYKAAHPEAKDMRTSLGLLHLGQEQLTFAWVGEVMLFHYDYRAERLVSLTEGMPYDVKARVTGMDKPQHVHLKQIPVSQLGPGDFFFLGTRGIGEHVDRNTLNTLLKPVKPDSSGAAQPDALVEEIRNLSQGFAQEDFSCYLIQVDRIEGAAAGPPPPQAEPEATPQPEPAAAATGNSDKVFWRQIIVATLFIVLLAIVILAWWNARRHQPYDAFLARGEAFMASNEHGEAVAMFDSAYQVAASEHERQEAARLKGKAIALSEVEGDALLTEPAETYLAEAERHVAAGEWAAALDAFEKAARAQPSNPDQPVVIPDTQLARAHLGLGDQSYEQEVRDCEAALANYEAAFRLYESPELDPTGNDQYAQAQTRAAECIRVLAAATGDTAREALAEGTTPQGTRSRGLAPAGTQPATTEPAPAVTPTQPDPRASRIAQPDPSTTRVAQPEAERSGLSSNTLSAEAEAELRKQMDAGKRLFSKARTSNSPYEYRMSAQNLEAAAPILDGSGHYLLAYLYHTGDAGQKDPDKALRYAQKAAAQGWPAGQYLYGHLLLIRGNPRDTTTAIESLKRARDNNFLEAIQRLQALGIQ